MSPKEETTSFEVILNQLVEWGQNLGLNILRISISLAVYQSNDKSAKILHNVS